MHPEELMLGIDIPEEDQNPQKNGQLIADKGNGLVRLITNPSKYPHLMEITESKGHQSAVAYLDHVIRGAEGIPYCHFVKAIHRNNGLYSMDVDLEITPETLEKTLDRLRYVLKDVIPNDDPYTRLSTVTAVFTDESFQSMESLKILDQFRQDARTSLLREGMLPAIVHPLHPIGRNEVGSDDPNLDGEPLFLGAPQLMLRNIDRRDQTFMKTEETREIFDSLMT